MPQKWWVLAAVACGTFMATLDSSIVNIALPTLTREFDTEISRIKWVVISYLLSLICLTLPFGRLSDYYGRKRIFMAGYTLFTVGSLLCGLSPTLNTLLASRALQGVGAAMMMANGPAVITSVFPTGHRGVALGILSMVVSLGLLSGPSLGGFLLSKSSWHSLFLINIPIGILGAILAYKNIPGQSLVKRTLPFEFDWPGVILQASLLIFFIAAVESPELAFPGIGVLPYSRPLLAILTVILFVFFVRFELSAKTPILDLSLFKIPIFWAANLASFLCFVAFSSVAILMPFFLEGILGYTSDQAGIIMTANPLAVLFVAPISGRLSDKIGPNGLSAAGAFLCVLTILSMAGFFGTGISSSISRTELIFALTFMGISAGIFQSPNNNSIMSAVPVEKLGAASALLATMRNLGLVTGTGLSTGLLSWRYGQTLDQTESFHFVLYFAAAFGICAFITCLVKINNGLEA